MNIREKPCLLILCDLGEENWTVRLCCPGMIPWKWGNPEGREVSSCAFAPESNFKKKDYSRKEVVNICKTMCKKYNWLWEDIYGENGEEVIDYESKTCWIDGKEFKLDDNGNIIV